MDIREILTQWAAYQDNIRKFRNGPNAYDIPYFISQFHELARFLQEKEAFLREWMMEYLRAHRQTIFMKWWRKHIYDWAMGSSLLHPLAEQEWDMLFGNQAVSRFSTAAKAVEKINAMGSIERCDDITILAIHEGLDCTSFPCNYCDERDDAWKYELQRRLIYSQHPLLNPAIKIWDTPRISNEWTLPHIWGIVDKKICYNLDKYKEHMFKERVQNKLFTGETEKTEKTEKTGREYMQDFIWKAFEYRGWGVDRFEINWTQRIRILPKNMKDDYEIFCILWNVVDLISFTISLDLPWLKEIEQMM